MSTESMEPFLRLGVVECMRRTVDVYYRISEAMIFGADIIRRHFPDDGVEGLVPWYDRRGYEHFFVLLTPAAFAEVQADPAKYRSGDVAFTFINTKRLDGLSRILNNLKRAGMHETTGSIVHDKPSNLKRKADALDIMEEPKKRVARGLHCTMDEEAEEGELMDLDGAELETPFLVSSRNAPKYRKATPKSGKVDEDPLVQAKIEEYVGRTIDVYQVGTCSSWSTDAVRRHFPQGIIEHIMMWQTKSGLERYFTVLSLEGYNEVMSNPEKYKNKGISFRPMNSKDVNVKLLLSLERYFQSPAYAAAASSQKKRPDGGSGEPSASGSGHASPRRPDDVRDDMPFSRPIPALEPRPVTWEEFSTMSSELHSAKIQIQNLEVQRDAAKKEVKLVLNKFKTFTRITESLNTKKAAKAQAEMNGTQAQSAIGSNSEADGRTFKGVPPEVLEGAATDKTACM